jgi:large subunit ribosomal protein L3
MKVLLGKKIGMTQIFQQDKVIPVTLVQAGPCTVTQVKTKERDGYEAVQIGFEKISKSKNITKSRKQKPFAYLKEFRGVDGKVGTTLDVSIFKEGDKVRISGISKGKGFQGGVKRHGFSGRKATHGVKHEQRTIGSTGMSVPERVVKGRRMPGRMGLDRITVKDLKIAKVDTEQNILAVQGAMPGRRGTLLEVRGIEYHESSNV